MLFKPEHVQMILEHRKVQTRRLWQRPMVKVGGLYWAQTKLFKPDSRFARLRVTKLWREPLWRISQSDALAEGYESIGAYLEAFRTINQITSEWVWQMALQTPPVWCVKFEVVEVVEQTP